MRIGGGIPKSYSDPDGWIELVRDLEYSAVLAPVDYTDAVEVKQTYIKYARGNNLVFGEVGIWKNSLAKDEQERREALEFSRQQLALADELHANCCVNIAGTTGEIWDGCYKSNYSGDTYALIVDTVRSIIDSVKPRHTFYTLEPMPWMHPDSPDDYLQLIKDIDRKAMGVHLDYTNMINSVDRYLNSTEFIKDCYKKLGPYIKSIHAKDVYISNILPCGIREVAPGQGSIDFAGVLQLTEQLGPDTTLFVEHMQTYEEYKNAVSYIRGVAGKEKVNIKKI